MDVYWSCAWIFLWFFFKYHSWKIFSCFLSKKGEKNLPHVPMCQLFAMFLSLFTAPCDKFLFCFCHYLFFCQLFVIFLSPFAAPCDKFGKKAYTELSWLDVMSSVWTMLTQQITPFHVLSFFNNPAIQFTLNPSHNPKKSPTTFSPPLTQATSLT